MAKRSAPAEPPRAPCQGPHCRNTLPLRTSGTVGRPPRFCSDACRVAGHRRKLLWAEQDRQAAERKRAQLLLGNDVIVSAWADTYQKLTGFRLTDAQVCRLPELLQGRLFP